MDIWAELKNELRQQPSPVSLWWRDDDAIADSPALQQLLSLAEQHSVAVHLAVIPQRLETSLDCIGQPQYQPICYVMQHGISHQSHALEGQRKVELGGGRPVTDIISDLREGRQILAQHFGDQYVDILVPPWNRLSDEVQEQLPGIGYSRLSVLGPRPEPESGELPQLNVHLDIIDWKARQFAGDETILRRLLSLLQLRRMGQLDEAEPLGLMTHHLDHDAPCWDFIDRFLAFSHAQPNIQWLAGQPLTKY